MPFGRRKSERRGGEEEIKKLEPTEEEKHALTLREAKNQLEDEIKDAINRFEDKYGRHLINENMNFIREHAGSGSRRIGKVFWVRLRLSL